MTAHRAERAYLHIGSPKTATSTIQRFLFHNADALLKQGYLFPRSAGPPNQTFLAIYATGARVNAERARPADVARMRGGFEARLVEEVSLKRPTNLVFSNEHLFSRTKRPAQIARIRELLALALF
ncbi:MAG: hypothetical protein IH940_09265, partial [Acidobacteria bacterium]|nr:hypothetical protein [Acidobacteriota bacterium]